MYNVCIYIYIYICIIYIHILYIYIIHILWRVSVNPSEAREAAGVVVDLIKTKKMAGRPGIPFGDHPLELGRYRED